MVPPRCPTCLLTIDGSPSVLTGAFRVAGPGVKSLCCGILAQRLLPVLGSCLLDPAVFWGGSLCTQGSFYLGQEAFTANLERRKETRKQIRYLPSLTCFQTGISSRASPALLGGDVGTGAFGDLGCPYALRCSFYTVMAAFIVLLV